MHVILQLPMPSSFGNVNWDSKGLYSVKSAYRLGIDEVSHLDLSYTNTSMVNGGMLFGLQIFLQKLKKFGGELFTTSFRHPTMWNLRNNHIPASLECKLCGHCFETIFHILFWCPAIRHLWNVTDFAEVIRITKSSSMANLLSWARTRWDREALEIFMVLGWEMWNL